MVVIKAWSSLLKYVQHNNNKTYLIQSDFSNHNLICIILLVFYFLLKDSLLSDNLKPIAEEERRIEEEEKKLREEKERIAKLEAEGMFLLVVELYQCKIAVSINFTCVSCYKD